jgi:hypothetical protein
MQMQHKANRYVRQNYVWVKGKLIPPAVLNTSVRPEHVTQICFLKKIQNLRAGGYDDTVLSIT